MKGVKERADGKTREVTGRLMQSLKSAVREFGFYSEFAGRTMKGFSSGSNIVWFYLKDHRKGIMEAGKLGRGYCNNPGTDSVYLD